MGGFVALGVGPSGVELADVGQEVAAPIGEVGEELLVDGLAAGDADDARLQLVFLLRGFAEQAKLGELAQKLFMTEGEDGVEATQLAGVIEFEFVEIGEDDPIDAAVPGVIGGLADILGVGQFGAEFLGFEQEAGDAFDFEGVIDAAPLAASGFAGDFGVVLHIPAEGGEEGVDEVGACGGLREVAALCWR